MTVVKQGDIYLVNVPLKCIVNNDLDKPLSKTESRRFNLEGTDLESFFGRKDRCDIRVVFILIFGLQIKKAKNILLIVIANVCLFIKSISLLYFPINALFVGHISSISPHNSGCILFLLPVELDEH